MLIYAYPVTFVCHFVQHILQSPNNNVIAWNATANQYATKSQQFSVAALPTVNGTLPMYIGQRFGSAVDGLKCHDFQYWAPLSIAEDGTIGEVLWQDSFTVEINVSPPQA